LKKIATLRCATAALAQSLLCDVADEDGEAAEAAASLRRHRPGHQLPVRRVSQLPQPRRKREPSESKTRQSKKRLLAQQRPGQPKPATPRLGQLRLDRLRRGQLTLGRLRLGPQALDRSADPTRADLIRADLNLAALNSAGRNLGLHAVPTEPALRRSANCCTRGRRFSSRLPKSLSPKKARASLLT
jgi:hypothetical protein